MLLTILLFGAVNQGEFNVLSIQETSRGPGRVGHFLLRLGAMPRVC